MSKIEDKVIDQIRQRAKEGKNKYGVTMERDDLTLKEWVQHAQEEAMDLAVYLEKIKSKL
jgi:ATP-dependent Clp protease adapter protein ClpS